MRNLRTWTAGVAVLMAGAAIAVGIMPSEAAAPRRNIALILDYQTAKSCTVYPNYPKAGVKGNNIGWKINPGDKVSWRYNVNRTWAVISDVKYEHSQHPWWGFTHRSCIGGSIGGEHFPTPTSSYPAGKPIPSRILQGRSATTASHYRRVNFTPSSGHVIKSQRIDSMGTLRDARGRFVIGNVFPGWHVRRTNVVDGMWTKVYVPQAKRWGWIQTSHF
jgi:hypothetical protein